MLSDLAEKWSKRDVFALCLGPDPLVAWNCDFFILGLSINFGCSKTRLNETVLLSTHNICFGLGQIFYYTLLSGGLLVTAWEGKFISDIVSLLIIRSCRMLHVHKRANKNVTYLKKNNNIVITKQTVRQHFDKLLLAKSTMHLVLNQPRKTG